MAVRILLRKDLASVWTLVNPILADGEIGFEKDTTLAKVGDGTSTWTELPYSFTGSEGNPILLEHTFAFGDPSPLTIYVTTAIRISSIDVEIIEAFNGTSPTISVGVTGDEEKYVQVSENNPSEIGRYQICPVSIESEVDIDVKLYVTPGVGATAGSGIITIKA
jgi:hypothetical protein